MIRLKLKTPISKEEEKRAIDRLKELIFQKSARRIEGFRADGSKPEQPKSK